MGEQWKGRVVVYAGDNTVVKQWLQGRKSKVRGRSAVKLVRESRSGLRRICIGDKSQATERAYAGAWAKWKAWARRQQWVSEYLDRSEDAVERENKLLAYVGYLGWLGASVNTIRQNIFAIKMAHKRVGAGDVTDGMHRIWILLGGDSENFLYSCRRRNGVRGSAWFYMLRCKELADPNGVDEDMILRGCDVRFSTDGLAVETDPEEVTIQFRRTKVDQLSFGDAKTLKATGRRFLCPVEALFRMRRFWPGRFQNCSKDSSEPLFQWASGGVLKRLEIQHLLQKAAHGVGLPRDRFLSHSLRVGGATALYQATSDIELVKRLGRWSSSAVHRYLQDGGEVTCASRRVADVNVKYI
eukprot:s366_g54.t1